MASKARFLLMQTAWSCICIWKRRTLLKRSISLSSSFHAGSCLMTRSLPRFTYLRLSVCTTRTIRSHDLWLFRCEYFVLVEEFCIVLDVLCNKLVYGSKKTSNKMSIWSYSWDMHETASWIGCLVFQMQKTIHWVILSHPLFFVFYFMNICYLIWWNLVI